MKNHYLLLLFISASYFLNAQIVSIPDSNYKNVLINTNCADLDNNGTFESDVDTNDDGEIQINEAEAVYGLLLRNQNIDSLSGIDAFKRIKMLDCSHNNLTSLDVSKNDSLTKLNCPYNKLTSLDLSKNAALTHLWCYKNQLNNLDLTKNTLLTYLHCSSNKLTGLNLEINDSLSSLECSLNQIKTLSLPKSLSLTKLICPSNQLTDLDGYILN